MDQPLNGEVGKKPKKDIDPLPPKENEFWDKAEMEYITLGKDRTCEKGGHFFIYKSAREIRCNKCPVGYYLGVEQEVKDGHIYFKKQLLV